MILLVRCLCQRKNLLLLAEGFSLGFFQLLSGMRRLFLKTVPFDDSGSIPMERAVSQERICQQAERLLSSYGNSVLQLAYSYLHNISDAEEVLQDTLVQFLKTAPVLEHKEHEKAWFLRVAANLSKTASNITPFGGRMSWKKSWRTKDGRICPSFGRQ